MSKSGVVAAGTAVLALFGLTVGASAQTVMQQCGQQYQAAKAAGTLNGMTWNQFRTDCAAKLKAQPAATAAPAAPAPAPTAAAPTPAPTAAAPAPANPLNPAPVAPAPQSAGAGAARPVSQGRAAMLSREKECGAEWRSQKAQLVAQTPGLTWPKYWSQCNARLKAAGK